MIDELKKLQNELAFLDLLGGRSDVMELKVFTLQPMKLKIYQEKKHPMSHLHIDYGKNNHAASYSIQKGTRIEGGLPNKYDKKVTAWILKNQVLLLEIWDEIQQGKKDKYEVSIGQLLK